MKQFLCGQTTKLLGRLKTLLKMKRKKVIDDARASAPEMLESFKSRQKALFIKKKKDFRY